MRDTIRRTLKLQEDLDPIDQAILKHRLKGMVRPDDVGEPEWKDPKVPELLKRHGYKYWNSDPFDGSHQYGHEATWKPDSDPVHVVTMFPAGPYRSVGKTHHRDEPSWDHQTRQMEPYEFSIRPDKMAGPFLHSNAEGSSLFDLDKHLTHFHRNH